MPRSTPVVFISSTSEDLASHRGAAKEAAIQAGFHPQMMEYFPAQGNMPPYPACMEKVDACDVMAVVVAHRYGWVPEDQPKPCGKSITWLECEHARNQGKEVLAFVVDENHPWPPAFVDKTRDAAKLRKFKKWLDAIGIRSTFTTPESLQTAVLAALHDWQKRHGNALPSTAASGADPGKYLRWLREETAWIDIRGLQVGSGKAHRFPIEDLYIPLTTVESSAGREPGGELREPVLLEQALAHSRLVIVGDPGSGKTTFLRRIGYELCGAGGPLKLATGFPIFLRIADLAAHMTRWSAAPGAPMKEAPAWLTHFLSRRSEEFQWDLDQCYFEQKLKEPSTLLLLDGLDEAPGRVDRESIARLFENATAAWSGCRFVVTTRPGAYTGRATLSGFHQVRIDDLEPASIELFLDRWSRCLYPDNAARAAGHHKELLETLRARVEIRRMARNPVMLTALAVVHWNERSLPEQRADLYESVLRWLARSREQRTGREAAERCLELLGHLALEMQDQPRGRLVEISKGPAAAILAPQWRGLPEAARLKLAQDFLDQEEVDSGIVVSRAAELRFWHLTFQEYLAARAIAGLPEAAQQKLLLTGDRLYRPEWREVVLLLAGILLVKQGRAKVDGMFRAILDTLGAKASLAAQARCAGLLGAILRDLRPLKYEPSDERYRRVLDAALGIFDAEKSKGVDLPVRLEAAEALGQAGDPRLRDPRTDEDYWVPIDGKFRIGRYPVTVEEYRRFVEDDGYENQTWWAAGGFGQRTQPDQWDEQILHPNRPVVYVKWFEAAAYCAWAGGRLPTEAEWERAAAGAEGRTYPWGNEEPDPSRAN